jgi:hypothetical protein
MAGTSLGATAPHCHHVPIVTRTRREFGAVVLSDGHLFTVMASRRVHECIGVNLQVADQAGTDLLRGVLAPVQARILARALIEAAAAVDAAQRRPQFTRGGAA